MPVYSLQIVNGAQTGRQGSQTSGTDRYIVAARDEADARRNVASFERNEAQQLPGLAEEAASPWQDQGLTQCREMAHYGANPPAGLIIKDTTAGH